MPGKKQMACPETTTRKGETEKVCYGFLSSNTYVLTYTLTDKSFHNVDDTPKCYKTGRQTDLKQYVSAVVCYVPPLLHQIHTDMKP